MDTKILIHKVVDYIENHLTADNSMEDIAEVSGFSMYHFCHVFSSLMGLPVRVFVTKRRLHHAIYQECCKTPCFSYGDIKHHYLC